MHICSLNDFFSEVFATVSTTLALNGKALDKNKTEIRKTKAPDLQILQGQ